MTFQYSQTYTSSITIFLYTGINPKQTVEYWKNVTKEFRYGEDILWNRNQLTWTLETSSGALWDSQTSRNDSENVVYYHGLPDYLRNLFPLLGTHELASGNEDEIYLPDTSLVYMVLQKHEEAIDINLAGWAFTGDYGYYLGPNDSNEYIIYQKLMREGRHYVYQKNALYLFVPGMTEFV